MPPSLVKNITTQLGGKLKHFKTQNNPLPLQQIATRDVERCDNRLGKEVTVARSRGETTEVQLIPRVRADKVVRFI